MASPGTFTISTSTPQVSRACRRPRVGSSAAAASRPRCYVLCQSSRPPGKPPAGGGGGEEKSPWWAATAERLYGGAVKAGTAVRESLSPKHKGDWKDVTLMSLSFAVYVYISQKLVCTYCAWLSMINHR